MHIVFRFDSANAEGVSMTQKGICGKRRSRNLLRFLMIRAIFNQAARMVIFLFDIIRNDLIVSDDMIAETDSRSLGKLQEAFGRRIPFGPAPFKSVNIDNQLLSASEQFQERQDDTAADAQNQKNIRRF